MRKKYYRYFGCLFSMQEKWLNKMAECGYHLIRTEKILYEFEQCEPGKYQYIVEFVGHKSAVDSIDFRQFLEDVGYCVFVKNINLTYSVGKIRYRPWADKGGRISTLRSTYNQEILIIECEKGAIPTQLHTSYKDKITYFRSVLKPWRSLFFFMCLLAIFCESAVYCIFALLSLIPLFYYQTIILVLQQNSKIKEQ